VKKLNKVLLIDDDQITNEINKTLLRNLDFANEIVIRENGRKGLEYLQVDCYVEGNYPSLILIDLSMPVMDGFDFLKEFERIDYSKKFNIEVVVLTNTKDGSDILQLNRIGRYHFIQKPLTIDKIIDIYHRYFRNWGFWKILD
jgi:CheY-like chemotaxis protein